MAVIYAGIAIALAMAALALVPRRGVLHRFTQRRLGRVILRRWRLALFAALIGLPCGYRVWFDHRPLPPAEVET